MPKVLCVSVLLIAEKATKFRYTWQLILPFVLVPMLLILKHFLVLYLCAFPIQTIQVIFPFFAHAIVCSGGYFFLLSKAIFHECQFLCDSLCTRSSVWIQLNFRRCLMSHFNDGRKCVCTHFPHCEWNRRQFGMKGNLVAITRRVVSHSSRSLD